MTDEGAFRGVRAGGRAAVDDGGVKGGSRQGIYLQVVAGKDSDAEIPGRPYGFRTVIEAQSRGDAQALRATGQPVARVTLAEAVDAVDAALGAG